MRKNLSSELSISRTHYVGPLGWIEEANRFLLLATVVDATGSILGKVDFFCFAVSQKG